MKTEFMKIESERQENNWRRFYNCITYMRAAYNEDIMKRKIFTNLTEDPRNPTQIAKKMGRDGDCKKTRKSIKELEEEKFIRKIDNNVNSNNEDKYVIVKNLKEKDDFLKELLKKLIQRESEIDPSEDQLKFFLGDNDEFLADTYFQMFWTVRLLNVNRKERERDRAKETLYKYDDVAIPKIVHQFWKWWIDLGSEGSSKSKNMDGMENRLIDNQKIPNPIKIHILSRYIMRRNYSMGGPNQNNEAIKDNQIALQYAEKFLKKQRRAKSTKSVTFNENNFYSQQAIEVLLNIELALFKVRSENDIDEIIVITSNTLGVVLMEKNRIWRSISLFWCYQILWRCFICKGENDMADTFKENALVTIKSLAEKHDIVLSGSYANWGKQYDDTNASNHLKIIEETLEKKSSSGKEKIPLYSEKIDDLVESRRIFYEDFIKIDEDATRWFSKKGVVKKRSRNLLTHTQDKNNWEERIVKIPKTMKKAILKLEDDGTIVSFPATKLVIVDLLLYISRLATNMNASERKKFDEEEVFNGQELKKNRKKIISKDEKNKMEKTWKILRKSLIDIKDTIQSTKDRIELSLGEESVKDLKLIIERLEDLIAMETVIGHFLIEGNKKTVPVSISKKAGEEIQKLLKEIKSGGFLQISFPVKMKPQN